MTERAMGAPDVTTVAPSRACMHACQPTPPPHSTARHDEGRRSGVLEDWSLATAGSRQGRQAKACGTKGWNSVVATTLDAHGQAQPPGDSFYS
eukprot:300571-Chlamydomonas_euryale.AAC.25